MLDLTAFEERKLAEAGCEWITTVTVYGVTGYGITLASGCRNISEFNVNLLDAIQNIDDVSSIELAVDPITRRVQVSTVTVRAVDDGSLRAMSEGASLKGAVVVINLHSADQTTGDDGNFRVWRGVVEDVVMNEGFVTLQCIDPLRLTEDVETYRLLVGQHPLEAIATLLADVGEPDDSIDHIALDPATDPAISHLNISGLEALAGDDGTTLVNNEAPDYGVGLFPVGIREDGVALKGTARDIIDHLATQCGGGVWHDERGKTTFKRYAEPTAVNDTWTEDDILDLDVLQTFDGMINEVHVQFGFGAAATTYTYVDAQSQADHRPGIDSPGRRALYEMTMPFAGARVYSYSFNASTQALSLFGWGVAGLSGCRVSDTFKGRAATVSWLDIDPFKQPPGAAIGSGRFVYLQVESEIIRLTAGAIDGGSGTPNLPKVFETSEIGMLTGKVSFFPVRFASTVADRGFGGTTAATHGGVWTRNIRDVTPARMVAETLVARCRNGLPKLRVRTTRRKFKYTLGDFIELSTDEFFWWGLNGLTSVNSLWWEITKKKFNPIEGWIDWELSFAKLATPQSTANTTDVPIDTVYTMPEERPGAGGIWAVIQTETIAAAAADYDIKWSDELISGGGSMDLVTGEWTCLRDGVYSIGAQIGFAKGSEPTAAQLKIQVNGFDIFEGPWVDLVSVTDDMKVLAAYAYPLVGGDVVTVVARMYLTPSGGSVTIGGNGSRLQIARTGSTPG